MRIIAGEKRGFPLKAPRGSLTRPTLGRVRESLFSILAADVIGAHVLDLFAGSGALGLEALSRGAKECTFVEQARPALEALRANIAKLGYEDRCKVLPADAYRWLEFQKTSGWPRFTLVFSDPPYLRGDALRSLEAVSRHLPLELNSTVVIQSSTREELPDEVPRLRRYRVEKYGDTNIHFYVCWAVT